MTRSRFHVALSTSASLALGDFDCSVQSAVQLLERCQQALQRLVPLVIVITLQVITVRIFLLMILSLSMKLCLSCSVVQEWGSLLNVSLFPSYQKYHNCLRVALLLK